METFLAIVVWCGFFILAVSNAVLLANARRAGDVSEVFIGSALALGSRVCQVMVNVDVC